MSSLIKLPVSQKYLFPIGENRSSKSSIHFPFACLATFIPTIGLSENLGILTFKQILEILLNLIQKKRILLSVPLVFGKINAFLFELLPKPLLTRDQLKLLKYNNINSGKYKTNFDIGVPSNLYFKNEVQKYCYMWKEGGEYSKEKFNSK